MKPIETVTKQSDEPSDRLPRPSLTHWPSELRKEKLNMTRKRVPGNNGPNPFPEDV
jgi:hypothetical protein